MTDTLIKKPCGYYFKYKAMHKPKCSCQPCHDMWGKAQLQARVDELRKIILELEQSPAVRNNNLIKITRICQRSIDQQEKLEQENLKLLLELKGAREE